jgi:hypothetical protein
MQPGQGMLRIARNHQKPVKVMEGFFSGAFRGSSMVALLTPSGFQDHEMDFFHFKVASLWSFVKAALATTAAN